MGCVSLSAAVVEVSRHLLEDDWIEDELSAPALNIRGQQDRDIATATKARQFALLEEQRGPLLERATAWLGLRLYGTPPDYGDAVPSYIPSWYGKLWRLSVGFWNKHSVQEVLFTEVEYNPADYGEIPPLNSRSFKGRVVILQEALREAITRDRPINQTDSGIDATASVEEGVADGSSSHSADNLPDKQPSRVGRPTLDAEIKVAYQELRDAGDINYDAPMNTLYEPIRKKIQAHKGNPSLKKGLRDEAIRKVISPLFEEDKNKRLVSP